MATDSENFNKDLYDLLKVRGYDPTPLNSKNQRVNVSQDADVFQFDFKKDGKDYGKAWVTVDAAHNVIVYYNQEQQNSPSTTTPGVEYDDTWTGFCKVLKSWAQRRQLGFELKNASYVGDDMRQRDYYRMKEKLGESRFFSSKKPYSFGLTFKDMDRLSESARRDSHAFDRNIRKNLSHLNLPSNFNTLELYGIYARHIVENKHVRDDDKNDITPIEQSLFKEFTSRTSAADPISSAKVGDKVSVLHLTTLVIPGHSTEARLYGFLAPKEVVDIRTFPDSKDQSVKQLVFSDGDKFPKSDVHNIYTITQGWNMTKLFDSYQDAEKAYMLYALAGPPKEKGLQMMITVDTKKPANNEKLSESYHAMGKKASYNDAVPNVKIILQHNRALEEGEQRYRNIARIFLENKDGERFLAPTTRPGIARVYARHIAEGGMVNDEKWNHIKSLCEEYNKMAGFVRATRNKQFNESAQVLINEGQNHYNNLRETLHKLTGHKGYHNYFENYTPLITEEGGVDISEMFTANTMDPRIESALPIISRLFKKVDEMKEVELLDSWSDELINETIQSGQIFEDSAEEKLSDLEKLQRINKDPIVAKAISAKISQFSKKRV